MLKLEQLLTNKCSWIREFGREWDKKNYQIYVYNHLRVDILEFLNLEQVISIMKKEFEKFWLVSLIRCDERADELFEAGTHEKIPKYMKCYSINDAIKCAKNYA